MRSGRPAPMTTADESTRLLALRNLHILDSGRSDQFDEIARLAATIAEAPYAFVTFVDSSRVWFKACVGVDPGEVDRATSFCSPAIKRSQPIFEVPDTALDPAFAQTPNVIGPPFIRFYAGVPLVIGGEAVGTLCVTDVVPRSLDSRQRESLVALARQVVLLLEYRTAALQLAQAHRSRDLAEAETSIFGKAVNRAINGLVFFGKRTGASESTVWFVNDYFCKATGADASRTIGSSVRNLVIQSGNPAAARRLRGVLAAGPCENVPIAFRLPGRPRRRFELSVSIIDHIGDERVYLAVLHDITERLANEKTLRETRVVEARNDVLVKSEARLRHLFAGTPAIMYTLDRELRFLSSLGGGLQAIGLRPDQVVGMLLADVTAPDDSEATMQCHKRALEGESVVFESDIFGRRFRTFLEPLRDAHAETCGVTAISFDLSEVARAERSGKTGSWLYETGNGEPTFSLEAQRLFGLSGEHARQAYFDRILPEDRKRVRERVGGGQCNVLGSRDLGSASRRELRQHGHAR